MPTKMPEYTNRLRIKLDFVVEFGALDGLPLELVGRQTEFMLAGLSACLPPEVLAAKYGDLQVLGNAGFNMEQMTKSQSDRWMREWTELRAQKGLPPPVVPALPKPTGFGQVPVQLAHLFSSDVPFASKKKPTTKKKKKRK
jgi:hypothetical protein